MSQTWHRKTHLLQGWTPGPSPGREEPNPTLKSICFILNWYQGPGAAINRHRCERHRDMAAKNRRAGSLTVSIQNITSFFLMSHSFPELCDARFQSVWVCVLQGGHGEGLLCVCVCVKIWGYFSSHKLTAETKSRLSNYHGGLLINQPSRDVLGQITRFFFHPGASRQRQPRRFLRDGGQSRALCVGCI